MSPELEDFRQRIVAHAKLAISRAPKIESEAATNASLLQPFLTTLGYDVTNPDEVLPEHHADFSEKYQNKVDYAILHNGVPVIAIESKKVGAALKDDRGQLRGYFNACPSVKLGILTDGIKYEFYADSDKPNMMDETSFLKLDLATIAKEGTIDDSTFGGIASIRSGSFNPEDVGAEAKRKLLLESVFETLKRFKDDPSDDFIRLMLEQSEFGNKISKLTQKVVDANRDVIRAAMELFIAREALARFGYAPKDVVKTPPERQEQAGTAAPVVLEVQEDVICPSDTELSVLAYARNRLIFLCRNETLFKEVEKVAFKKTKGSFRVFYARPNNGSLFDYREHKDGKAIVQFPALGNAEIGYAPAAPEFDDHLLKAFTQRVTEAGVSFQTPSVLRAIEGGQSSGSA